MLVEELRVGAQEARDVVCVHRFFYSSDASLRTPSRPGPSSTPHCRRRPKRWSTCRRAFDPHRRVEQAARDAGDHRGAGAGAAGQRLAGAALPHAQRDAVAVEHLHVAGVDAVRESAGASRAAGPAWSPARSPRRARPAPRAGCPSTGWSTSTCRPCTFSFSSRPACDGVPMSTLTSPSASRRGPIVPPSVSTRISRFVGQALAHART